MRSRLCRHPDLIHTSMELEHSCPPTSTQNVKPVSRSLDRVAGSFESMPWRLVETREPSSPGPPFLVYTHRPIPRYQKSESDMLDSPTIRIPDLYYNYRMPDTPRPSLTPVPPSPFERYEPKPRSRVSTKTETRILAWLEDVEPVNHGPWVSFLPTCRASSNGSNDSLDSPHLSAEPRVEERKPEPETELTSFVPVFEDLAESTDEMDTWPYDGHGLYEHHPRHECGLACHVACRRRQTVRAGLAFGLGLGKIWTRMLPWTSAKRPVMLNSDVPHPPWRRILKRLERLVGLATLVCRTMGGGAKTGAGTCELCARL
ncbi:hypothetical protein RSAG8_08015, partial [Rhizoctonia solani AG-8 WAC10335]